MGFDTQLRHLIEERHLSQKCIATDMNMAPSTIGSYVQGKRKPDIETLKRFSEYFKVSTDYLLECQIPSAETHQENELIQVFRSLDLRNKMICLEHAKLLLRANSKQQD